MNLPTKTKYPNIPPNFRFDMRHARINRHMSVRALAEALEFKSPAAIISQYETGQRNISFEHATKIKEYLNIDCDLPLPRPDEAEPIDYNRVHKSAFEYDPFIIIVDGEVIEVAKYRRLGPITPCIPINSK